MLRLRHIGTICTTSDTSADAAGPAGSAMPIMGGEIPDVKMAATVRHLAHV
jgi:hypothetical protein